MAYAITGFAVLHTLDAGAEESRFWSPALRHRVVFGWPVLAMVALGLADAVFDS